MADSLSVSEAAALLGISIPTVKRMVAEGRLQSFRTPGGHLRILAESVEAVRERQPASRPVRNPSPVLQNRRERLEELTLEAQEHRARRELEKLRTNDREEAESRQAEARDRAEADARRKAELELERKRLAFEKSQARARQEREQDERAAAQQRAESKAHWTNWAASRVPFDAEGYLPRVCAFVSQELDRLSGSEPHQVVRALVEGAIERALRPYHRHKDAQIAIKQAVETLPWEARGIFTKKPWELKTERAATDAIMELDGDARLEEMCAVALEAVASIREEFIRHQAESERQQEIEGIVRSAPSALPYGATQTEQGQAMSLTRDALTKLPERATRHEMLAARDKALVSITASVKQRLHDQARQARKRSLIEQGVAEISSYLLELESKGELTGEECSDSGFRAELNEAVRLDLEAKLSGNEGTKEIQERVKIYLTTPPCRASIAAWKKNLALFKKR